ncbi:MAG: dTMP kinase [Acidimicrobiales bacterium]
MPGRYIAFEGGEGSGKSTQAHRLAQRIGAIRTFEPGATPLGVELRSLLLDVGRPTMGARAETLLMAADRAEHLAQVVEPALAEGRHVVSDRSLYSSMAYQGGARSLGLDAVRSINEWAVADRLPDIVVFLDLDPQAAVERLVRSLDRLEQAGPDFHRAVYDAYCSMAAADPDTWVVIDAAQPVDAIEAAIWAVVEPRL